MLLKEYRTCMPLTLTEYHIGQLYMISKHSLQQSTCGEGVEVVRNESHTHPIHGEGRFTEKRIYLNSKLPQWARSLLPQIFYITERAWNWYPFTETEYSCSFLPRFSVKIQSCYQNNNGHNDQAFDLPPLPPEDVLHLDIVCDDYPERYYKESEDLRRFVSRKTQRGPLAEGWRDNTIPIMCSYKRVSVQFEVYGLQGRVEQWIHQNIRDILLVGHRQAFAWVDEWIDMTLSDVRDFENKLIKETNDRVSIPGKTDPERQNPAGTLSRSVSVHQELLALDRDRVGPPGSPSTSSRGKGRWRSGE